MNEADKKQTEGVRYEPGAEQAGSARTKMQRLKEGGRESRGRKEDSMRILEALGEPLSHGGQEAFLMNVLENMDRTGMKIDILTPYYCDNYPAAGRIRQMGGEVFSLGCSFRPGSLRINAEGAIRRFLKEHEYDVIHIHSGSSSMLAMYARLADRAGIRRIIVHSHCTGRKGLKHSLVRFMTYAELMLYPTDYCACSREAGEWRFPSSVCRSRLNIINNGIVIDRLRYDPDVRNALRKQLGVGDDVVLIGNVGRLTYQKNQEYLLDLMADIRGRLALSGKDPGGYRLVLAGDGDSREMLERRAAELGLDDVIMTGNVNNAQDYYQAMDVLAMPSRYEGLAIAVIEAQAAGLEVVASEGIPDLARITDGIRMIPLENRAEWIDALMSLHRRHPEQAEQADAAGFGAEETAAAMRRLYISGQNI